MKKTIVTGGAGFIGSNLVDALVERGYETHVVDNLVSGKRAHVHPKAVFHELDVRETEKLKELFKGASCVFHLAALPRVQYSIEHPLETNEANVTGTLSVLSAAKDAGVKRVVYAASSSAYGDQEELPLHEEMPAMPKSPYALHKYVGELYARLWSELFGLETVSLRFFNVYGPRQSDEGAYALIIAKFLKQKRERKPLTVTGDGTQTRDFTHVEDVVVACLLAMESGKVGKGEVINIGSGKNISVNDIARLVGGKVEHIAPRIEPHDTLADTRRAKELLSWSPSVTIEEGIQSFLRQ
ncbi:MAG: NAD-dependent epimerase/dehydratase family protein [bacterium]|nr:NAD-dependent epimerase/dehydratase family protein [bacterium]